jgi:hypothetical protein
MHSRDEMFCLRRIGVSREHVEISEDEERFVNFLQGLHERVEHPDEVTDVQPTGRSGSTDELHGDASGVVICRLRAPFHGAAMATVRPSTRPPVQGTGPSAVIVRLQR